MEYSVDATPPPWYLDEVKRMMERKKGKGKSTSILSTGLIRYLGLEKHFQPSSPTDQDSARPAKKKQKKQHGSEQPGNNLHSYFQSASPSSSGLPGLFAQPGGIASTQAEAGKQGEWKPLAGKSP